MKITSILFALFFVIATVNASDKVSQGSREAAIQVTSDWLQGFYNKQKEPVTRTEISESSDNSMTVQASFQGLACTLNLKKNLNANKFGWVVEKHTCIKDV